MRDDFADGLVNLVFVGDVGCQAQMTFAQCGGGIACCGLVEIDDHHTCAMVGEGDRGCATDTARRCRTGDHCNFALKKHEGYL